MQPWKLVEHVKYFIMQEKNVFLDLWLFYVSEGNLNMYILQNLC